MLKNGLKKNSPLSWTTATHEEMIELGKELVKLLPQNFILCLEGDLGAGKTTLSKGIIEELTHTASIEILSPTYSYVRTYAQESITLHHFDCYRISGEDEFIELGLEDLLLEPGYKIIEWPDRITSLLPKSFFHLSIQYSGNSERSIELLEY